MPNIPANTDKHFRVLCLCLLNLFLTDGHVDAQENFSVEQQLRQLIPSVTAIDREVFETIVRASRAPKREDFQSRSLTAELMFLNHKTAQDSEGQFRYLTEGRMPKPTQFVQEMYRGIGKGQFRIVTHPVTMIQAERITKLDAHVDGIAASGSFEFRVPELYEGKVDFTAEKKGDDWRFTRFQMPKLDADVRSDASGHWWRTEDLKDFDPPKCLVGHDDTVWSLDYSEDGARVVSGSSDRSVRIWDVDRRDEVLTISGAHKVKPGSPIEGWLLGVCFSPDGKQIATCSDDGTVKFWNAVSGEFAREILVGNIVDQVLYTSDGKSLLTASGDLEVWDPDSGKRTARYDGHSFPTIAISPDGRYAVSAGKDPDRKTRDDTLKLLKLPGSRELVASTESHDMLITDVRFSPDGKRVASCSRDQTIKIWDAMSLELIATIDDRAAGYQSLAWSPDGRWIVSGDLDGGVSVWDSATGKLHEKFPEHPDGIRCVAFSPDGYFLATAGHDGVIRIWTINH